VTAPQATLRPHTGSSHGWALVDARRKDELIRAIAIGRATAGPLHAELDLTDRCNVACYFCNQQDTRTKLQIPLERAVGLIDEMAEAGLASVRLSGGGDPLHHREILAILDHLHRRGVVVDNLTTNAVSLTPSVARRLIDQEAREVNVSLNTVDGADYRRMMQVKPALFDRVLDNVRHLLAVRGERRLPIVTLQFLLDRRNAPRALEMDDLAREIGADRIVLSAVQQIADDRLSGSDLLDAGDAERLLPVFTEIYRRHPPGEPLDLELNLDVQGLGPMLAAARRRAGAAPASPFPIAPSFRAQDGGCFFAWYSTAITGNGNVYPCCQLIRPKGPVMGNVLEQGAGGVWHGERYERLRHEMREALLDGADRNLDPARFEILDPVCHTPGRCWLKTMYFQWDDAFYARLHEAVEAARTNRARVRVARGAAAAVTGRLPWLAPAVDRLRDASRPLRVWLRHRFGLDLTEAS